MNKSDSTFDLKRATDTSPRYAVDEPPAPGAVVEIAHGVQWVRMPLPFPALDHINLWLLEDGANAVLVDTGFGDETTRRVWDGLFSGALAGRHPKRLICTHYHGDHVGLAGWLTARFHCELWMSHGEFYAAHSVHDELASHQPARLLEMYRDNGLSAELRAKALEIRNSYRKNVLNFPPTFRRILHEDELTIGGRAWRVIGGHGHSPEHSALYCAELGVLIAGDMILPRITTNVSVQATEPNGNPLGLFLKSLARHAALPPDTLVLPSHGVPFRGLRERIAFIEAHHRRRLATLEAACATPRSAADVLGTLFKRELDAHQAGIAMGEALAHLHYLHEEGRLARVVGSDGVIRYVRTSGAGASGAGRG